MVWRDGAGIRRVYIYVVRVVSITVSDEETRGGKDDVAESIAKGEERGGSKRCREMMRRDGTRGIRSPKAYLARLTSHLEHCISELLEQRLAQVSQKVHAASALAKAHADEIVSEARAVERPQHPVGCASYRRGAWLVVQ